MTIKAIIFDIGGVIEYTPYTGWKEKWEGRIGTETGEIGRKLREMGLDGGLGTCTEEEWLAGLRQITGMSAQQTAVFMQDLWEDYLGTLNVELVEYIKTLRSKYTTAVLSNSFLGARRKEQEHYGLEELFDLLIYSHEVHLEKPDPLIYALICQQLQVHPQETIFVDDVFVNIKAAEKFGMKGVLFENNAQAIPQINFILKESVSKN